MSNTYIAQMEDGYRHKRFFSKIIRLLSLHVDEEKVLQEALYGISKHFEVLDFGCGSGLVSANLAHDLPFARITGYDSSLEMIEIARERFARPDSPIFTTQFEKLPKNHYDFIVLSSVLHEVFSNSDCRFGSITNLFSKLNELLKPGGYIITRDNYSEEADRSEIIELPFKNEEASEEALKLFRQWGELMRPSIGKLLLPVTFTRYRGTNAPPVIKSARSTICEFLSKLTWGEESLPREAQEILFFLTPEIFQAIIPKNWTIVGNTGYRDDSYLAFLEKWVDLSHGYPHWTHRWTLIRKNKE